MFIQFGAGYFYFNPLGGNQATPARPGQGLSLQDISVEYDQKFEKLMGQNKGPDDVATSDVELKIKAGIGQHDLDLYNNLIFGETIITGVTAVAQNELHTIPATPYQIPGTQTTAVKDLGVFFVVTGQPLQKVASGPVTGQYSVAVVSGTITYTFAAADTTLQVFLSYSYTLTTGRTLTVLNHLQGYGPYGELFLGQPYQGTNGMHFYKVKGGKISAPQKRAGYMISEIEIEAFPQSALTGAAFFDWFDVSENVI